MGNTVLQQSLSTTILVSSTGKYVIQVLAGGGGGSVTKQPKIITADYTVQRSDIGRFIFTDASGPVNIFFPNDIPFGEIGIIQRGTGQWTVVPISGATFRNVGLRSAGQDTEQKEARLLSYGDGTAVLLGNTVEGIALWSIIGNAQIDDGDVTNYAIWRPDSTKIGNTTIKVTGTGFASSGLQQTLEQALTQLTKLDPYVTFDGVDTLTISPLARNPLPLQFYASPSYTTVGDRTIRITLSNPSVGSLSGSAAYVDTVIKNIARVFDPVDLFSTHTKTLAAGALSGATTLQLVDVDKVDRYGAVTGSGIAANTYITDITGTTITLNNAITTNLSLNGTISVKRAGFYFDFNDASSMVMDGSNNVASVADKNTGLTISMATANRKPVYSATGLSGHGALTFDGSNDALQATSAQLAKILDHARAEFTIYVIGKVNSGAGTGDWIDGPKTVQAHASQGVIAIGTAVTTAGLKELNTSEYFGVPFILSAKSDGSTVQVKANGARAYVPVTMTADAAAGQKDVSVDDISNIKNLMFARVTKTKGIRATESSNVGIMTTSEYLVSGVNDSPKTVTMNQNLLELMRSGQELEFFSHVPTNLSPTVAKTTTTLSIGGSVTNNTYVAATIGAILMVPRYLPHQIELAIVKFFSQRYAASTTTTTSGTAAAGTKKITVASTTNVKLYQSVSGTNIPTNATVMKVNTTTNEVWIDEPILTGGVGNGATLTFTNCGFKSPSQIDINNFDLLYHDGFELGMQLSEAAEDKWRPHYGDITQPGTFATAYGALGHGSSNNGTVEYEWYLDVLNYVPWKSYPVMIPFSDNYVKKGGVKFTAIPTPAGIADQVGYIPPQPNDYKYISAYAKWSGTRFRQYGYFECRFKANKVVGAWPAFWLTAANGQWPPECDVSEQYGQQPGVTQQTLHMSRNFSSQLFQNRSFNNVGDMIDNMGDRYITFGVELAPDAITFYINRQKTSRYMPNWDHHTLWYPQVNMAVLRAKVLNLIDEMPMWIDHVSYYRRKEPTVTLTGTEQSETTALLAAMSVQPSSGRKALINAVIEELKLTPASLGGSLWDRLDGIGCAEAHDAQAARIDWKNPARIGTVVGSPSFTVDRGYTGTLNSAYIDMGFTLSGDGSYQLNSALNQSHIGVVTSSVTNNTAIAVGTTSFNIMPKTGNQLTGSLWEPSRTFSIASVNGHFMMTRNHFHYAAYQDGELTIGKPTSGNNVHTTDSQTFRFANGATRVGWWHVGDYITQDDVRHIAAIIRKYRVAIGSV